MPRQCALALGHQFGFGRYQLSACLILFFAVSQTHAADWPMWRSGASRSNATNESLPVALRHTWTLPLLPQAPAWPASQTKLRFDENHHPIVVQDLLIVGSTVTDTITAYRTSDGAFAWEFTTDGPIRFAPVADKGHVYVASDDGYLYSVDAATGKLNWKVNGGPTNRRIIGNGRLVSTWPVRGGPVVADGTVYFTAGIWPFMGIFVHAVDGETGEILWTNSETGSRWITHPHGAPSFGSIVPQGYLAVSGDHLIVPGGRSLPGVFDRRTGEMLHFQFGGKGSGGWNICANDKMYAVPGAALEMTTGASIGSLRPDVLTNEFLIQGLAVQQLPDKLVATETKDRRGKTVKRIQLKPKKSWSIGSGSASLSIKVGNDLFSTDGKSVQRFDFEKSKAKTQEPTWSTKIDDDVTGMLAGDGKLFVVTDKPEILCFSEKAFLERPNSVTVTIGAATSGQMDKMTETILREVGTDHGYAIFLGRPTPFHGDLIEETSFQIIMLDPDKFLIDLLRQRPEYGKYGRRVTAHVGDMRSFSLPPYFASAIFAEDCSRELEADANDFVAKLFSALRPYGGTACLHLSEHEHFLIERAVAKLKLKTAAISRNGDVTFVKRDGPLPGSSTWTHQYGDAANSVVSKDKLVKAPLGLLWFGGPSNDKVLPRHGHGPSPQVAGGRLVIEGPDMLRCVDVYTGRVFWERDLPGLGTYYNTTSHFPGAGEIGSNYVTLSDAVYVVFGKSILELDPDTGKTRREFELEADAESPDPFWGFIAAEGDYLVATSSPVSVGVSSNKSQTKQPAISKDLKPVIDRGATWSYLAQADPADNWTSPEFKTTSKWKTGKAGFGYGDNDDRTKLEARGKYPRVYIRKEFDADDLPSKQLALSINFDDAFIAYLNGEEILRVGVRSGSGASARSISSHEASGFETFEIKGSDKLLKAKSNVLAIEGHNTSSTSSDFSLDPILLVKPKKPTTSEKPPAAKDDAPNSLVKLLSPTQYSSASRQMVVFDRATGKRLWSRTADFNFRHNCIVLAGERLFCIDTMSKSKLESLKRRGIEPKGEPRLLALEAKTGKTIWSTTENVFGTFLNYSAEYDVLLQAGSAYRDRARDEIGTGMVAYRGSDGSVVWKDLTRGHGGPCMLWRDKIITNGGGGRSLELLTGEETGWSYSRMYGCNTAVGSEHLLTFRSGAAGFYDLTGDSGTGNVGGFRSSCTANLIVADGVLNAPDYTRTCSCAYQNQSSLAMIHMPDAEMWTFSPKRDLPKHFGVNLGAPGDRRDPDGLMWYDTPSVGGNSPELPVTIEGKPRYVQHHSSLVKSAKSDNRNWVASSAAIGTTKISQKISKPGRYQLRLYFAELENAKPGERIFDVVINDTLVIQSLDIASKVGQREMLIKFLDDLELKEALDIRLVAKVGETCLSGYSISPN